MITYRDMTFCVNEDCQKKCEKYLTCEIKQAAAQFGLPVSVASFLCAVQDEDGVYKTDAEEMS